MDGTPIFDIKPYLLTTDCHPEASKGFTQLNENYQLDVEISDSIAKKFPADLINKLKPVLAQDPRPAYQHDENRLYGFLFDGFEVSFSVKNNILTVKQIKKSAKDKSYYQIISFSFFRYILTLFFFIILHYEKTVHRNLWMSDEFR